MVTQLEELIGHVLMNVEQRGNDRVIFTREDGEQFVLFHSQDCCESVYLEDICGDLSDLVGAPIVMAELVTSKEDPKSEYDECFMWSFYKFATIKGYVTMRWYGTSNGYYSVGVSFTNLKEYY